LLRRPGGDVAKTRLYRGLIFSDDVAKHWLCRSNSAHAIEPEVDPNSKMNR
jgi:hypothetical protein